jgi:hypothetical protein
VTVVNPENPVDQLAALIPEHLRADDFAEKADRLRKHLDSPVPIRIHNRPDFQFLFGARGPGTVEIFAGPPPENPDWKRGTMIGSFEVEDFTLDYIKAGVTPVALDQWEVVHLPSGEALDGVVEANAKERWIERYISPEQVDALIAAGRIDILILHPGESARERVEGIDIRIQRKRT